MVFPNSTTPFTPVQPFREAKPSGVNFIVEANVYSIRLLIYRIVDLWSLHRRSQYTQRGIKSSDLRVLHRRRTNYATQPWFPVKEKTSNRLKSNDESAGWILIQWIIARANQLEIFICIYSDNRNSNARWIYRIRYLQDWEMI